MPGSAHSTRRAASWPPSTTPPARSSPRSSPPSNPPPPTCAWLHTVIVIHGLPAAIYQDRHSALHRNDRHWSLEEELAGHQQPTHVGQALAALGLEAVVALSPQAKGRIERLFGTLQDRVVAELALEGVHTPAEANAWLPTGFLPRYDPRFARPPQEVTPAFRPTRGLDLDRLCSLAYTATVGHDHAVRLGGLILDLPPGPRGRRYAKARVDVRQRLDGSWRVYSQDGLIATAPPTGPADELRTLKRRRPAAPSAPPLSVFNGGHFHVAVKGTD